MIKVITLLLIFMAVLAMFGRLRFPRISRRASNKCGTCGRPRIGKGPCECGAKS
jgi:hypothetical protein